MKLRIENASVKIFSQVCISRFLFFRLIFIHHFGYFNSVWKSLSYFRYSWNKKSSAWKKKRGRKYLHHKVGDETWISVKRKVCFSFSYYGVGRNRTKITFYSTFRFMNSFSFMRFLRVSCAAVFTVVVFFCFLCFSFIQAHLFVFVEYLTVYEIQH